MLKPKEKGSLMGNRIWGRRIGSKSRGQPEMGERRTHVDGCEATNKRTQNHPKLGELDDLKRGATSEYKKQGLKNPFH